MERAVKACLRLLCVSLCTILRLVHGNVIPMGIPCETSYGMGRDRHKLLCDLNGTDKYVPWTTLAILIKLRCLSLNISANKLYGQKSGDCDFAAVSHSCWLHCLFTNLRFALTYNFPRFAFLLPTSDWHASDLDVWASKYCICYCSILLSMVSLMHHRVNVFPAKMLMHFSRRAILYFFSLIASCYFNCYSLTISQYWWS